MLMSGLPWLSDFYDTGFQFFFQLFRIPKKISSLDFLKKEHNGTAENSR
jgi:hypothetical protein